MKIKYKIESAAVIVFIVTATIRLHFSEFDNFFMNEKSRIDDTSKLGVI